MKTNKLQISRLTPIKSLKEFIEDIKNKTTNYLLEAFLRYSNLAKKTKKLLLVQGGYAVDFAVGRELKMVELKKDIKRLKKELESQKS